MNTNFFKYLIISVLLIICSNLSIAGNVTFSSKLEGSSIKNNAGLSLKDDQYDFMRLNPSVWQNQFKNNSVLNKIHLVYTGAETKHYSNSWFVETILSIDGWDENGNSIPSQQCTLKITYNPSAQTIYKDVNSFLFSNAHYVKVNIIQVNTSFSNNSVPNDVMLENVIEVDRIYNLDPTQLITITNTNNTCISDYNSKNSVEFHWDYLYGADEYDLEWVFKSFYDSNQSIDFSSATRITTPNQYFNLNLVFDKGFIYYRIRGITKDFTTNSKRLEGDWTYGNNPITVCNMEHRNWTYDASYAEDGKKKEIVTYFDGSERNRQTVTLSNTENVSLITENIYDYEGRSAIQTLPAPNKNYDGNLLFFKNLNLNYSGVPYSKKDFDTDNLNNNCNSTNVPGMLSVVPSSGTYNMGSSYYYSDQNTQAFDNGFGSAIPDANDYPFVQKVFSPKGHVKMQSGVGNVLNIGSGHETKYFQATASQEKLDRLFGNEVGYAEHYSENVTIDPNGQISVEYKNLSGNVIASAMRGDSPTNLNALNSKASSNNSDEPYMYNELINENFSDQNQFVSSLGAYVVEKDFMVTNTTSNYSFSYQISPQVFASICTNKNYNCKYVLNISITDECGNELTETQPSSNHILNENHLIDASNYTNTSYQLNFNVSFPQIGVYKIIKTLSIDPTSIQNAVDEYEADLRNPNLNTCITRLSEYQTTYQAGVDMTECNTCEENASIESLNYATAVVTDDNGNSIVFTNANDYYVYLKNQCTIAPPLKDCDELLNILKDDMSPNGQYFEFKVSGAFSNGSRLFTFQNNTSLIDALATMNTNVSSNTDFITDFNTYITLHGCNQLASNVNASNLYSYLKNNWDPCWAGFLVRFHPEYCRYERCQSLSTSSDFDIKLQSIDYLTATTTPSVSSPYLKLSTTPIGKSVEDLDPFFQTISSSSYSGMNSEISNCMSCAANFPLLTAPSSNSMWDWAAIAPTTLSTSTPSLSYNNQRWDNFVKLYLNVKSQYENNFGCSGLPDTSMPLDHISNTNNNVLQYNGNYFISLDGMVINDPSLNNTIASNVPATVSAYTNTVNSICTYTAASLTVSNLSSNGLVSSENSSTSCPTFTVCDPISISNALVPDSNECSYILYAYIPFVPQNPPTNMTAVSGTSCYHQISEQFNFPSSIVGLTNAQLISYYNVLKSAINNYSSTYGFTCDLMYASGTNSNVPVGYKIKASLLLGTLSNSVNIVLQQSCPSNVNQQTVCLGQLSGAIENCESESETIIEDCLCIQLNQLNAVYNQDVFGNASTYSSFYDYAAVNLALAYNYTLTIDPSQINFWFNNCINNKNKSPLVLNSSDEIDNNEPLNTEYQVPNELSCDFEENCQQQGIDEADFYASEAFENEVQNLLQDFVLRYKAACLNSTTLAEKFSVSYDEKEYHYTLYYYDQAGNLVRTVSPRAVDRLNPSQLYNGTLNKVNNARKLNSGFIYPNHKYATNNLVTNYKYNTLNKLVQQHTADAGLTKFWYNDIGMLRFSQNQKQANAICSTCGSNYIGKYSYTKYDGQGRIIEVGENYENQSSSNPFYNLANTTSFPNLLGTQVTKTYYDSPLAGNAVSGQFTNLNQQLLRKRVASVTYEDFDDADPNTYHVATHYSYDVHGNVFEIVQENSNLSSINQSYKKTQYTYDLISGKVNEINYQKNKPDQFHHRYVYDADNRITSVITSDDYIHWKKDARYFYYLHGPLARVELGEDKVQGIDYAYTLQGWVKAVNSNTLKNNADVGKDGYAGVSYFPSQIDLHKNVAKDIFGYSLNYYLNDYQSINAIVKDNITANIESSAIFGVTPNLYNGNIKSMSTALYAPNGSSLPTQMPNIAKFYAYDQLNRLQEAQSYVTTNQDFSNSAPHTNVASSDYYEFFRYDADGNIKTLKRNAYTRSSFNNSMDNINYNYSNSSSNNQLASITDIGDNSNSLTNFGDIKNQTNTTNYTYDAIGNLESDAQEDILNIEWTVYGKIKKITRTPSSLKSDLEFAYDASGNRIMKLEKKRNGTGYMPSNQWIYTYYSRDAQGNVLAVYQRKQNSSGVVKLFLTEQYVYGSSRLATVNKELDLEASVETTNKTDGLKGAKVFELSNHLGNVLTTISDRKLSVSADVNGLTTAFSSEVVSSTDYYSFGSTMPGRNYQSSSSYRYGMNSQEKDFEIAEGIYVAKHWEYDSRLGRRWNIDLVIKPWQSGYHAFSNKPILNIDPNGANDDEFKKEIQKDGTTTTKKISDLGGDKVDFTHIKGGVIHDGQTEIKSRATGNIVYTKTSKGIEGYTKRAGGISYNKIFDEFLEGSGPENSLITSPGMLQDIMKSPQFAEAFKAYIDAGAPSKFGYEATFGIEGAGKAGDNWTAQMIGKSNYSFYNVKDQLVITIMDSKSKISYSLNPLVKLIPEEWVNEKRNPSETIPESTTRQTYLMILPIKK